MDAIQEIMHEIKAPHTYLPLELFGVDISITKAVLFMFIAAFLVFLMVWLPGRRASLVPTKGQGLMESLLEFVRDGMIKEVMGEKGMAYFPFVATLFLFVLVSNLIGLIPGSYTPTTQTGTVWGWALLVSAVFIFVGIREHGPIGYLRTWIPSGTPLPLMPVLFVLEGFSNLIIRPFSLGIRLFANMLAGHMVIALFLSFAIAGAIYIKPISFAFVLVMYAFEIFVAFLQAYIYAILTAIYIGGALEEH